RGGRGASDAAGRVDAHTCLAPTSTRGARLRSRVAFRLNCDTVWHGFATEPRGIRLTPRGSRSIIDPSAVRRSGADRKEPCMLLQLHLRLPALAALLLLVLIAAG